VASNQALRHRALWTGCTGGILVCSLLTGCSSVSHVVADNWPRMLGGLPEGVPPRSETQPAYMPVHDTPPPRDTKKMTPEERAKYEAELAERRSQNNAEAEAAKSQSPPPLSSPR